jgi:hypothetical protein
MQHEKHGVPDPESGVQISAENELVLESDAKAREYFQGCCRLLLDVNHWHEMAGKSGANFQLVDHTGTEVNRLAKEGDYFKIDIPGPGTVAGHGYDWVRIEEISKETGSDSESLAIRVRPSKDPRKNNPSIAHFFAPEATSTFKVMRERNRIKASIHDRNTKPNTSAESPIDKVRNLAVATGAITAFSKVQWQSLVDGILHKKKKED